VADRHESHDLEAVVAFADGELPEAELKAVAAQVQTCRDCAELVADLRSLALANRRLATPVRPRDLRLTAADAERLQRLGPEPHVVATRLGLDMTGTPATLTIHASHDPELIAAAVSGALEAPERRLIETWLTTCTPCADLHADLLAIVSAERALPTPARTRDFQLTPADAHRLQPRGFRAILAVIGSSRDAFSKPLALGLTTLGLVGLLVGTVPSLGMGGAATSLSTVGAAINPAENAKSGEPYGQSETSGDGTVFGGQDLGPSAAPSAAAAAPAAVDPDASAAVSAASQAASSEAPASVGPEPQREQAAASAGDASTDGGTTLTANGVNDDSARLAGEAEGPSALLIASIVLLLSGVGLFAARWGARRLRAT
jgi:anti-sigma factor RsiW